MFLQLEYLKFVTDYRIQGYERLYDLFLISANCNERLILYSITDCLILSLPARFPNICLFPSAYSSSIAAVSLLLSSILTLQYLLSSYYTSTSPFSLRWIPFIIFNCIIPLPNTYLANCTAILPHAYFYNVTCSSIYHGHHSSIACLVSLY